VRVGDDARLSVRSVHGVAKLGLEAYRALYEHSPSGVLFTSPDGEILAANPAACAILGLTEVEICARGRQGLADGSDERWSDLLEARERAGGAEGVARLVRGDGVPIEVEMSSRLFTDTQGEVRSCTVFRDVTERVRLEREVAESRKQLMEAERMARMGSWAWDLVEGEVSSSDGLQEIYGLSGEQFDSTFDGGIGRVYPDDRESVMSAIERAIAQRSSFTIEYRAVRSDGRLRVLRSHGDVTVDESGEPVRVVGVVQDVTEATAARDLLQRTSEEFERRAAELQRLALSTTHNVVVPTAPLTARQLEVLRLVAEGMTNAAIADQLVVTEGTVKWHVKQILAKTQSANRAEAIARVLGGHGRPSIRGSSGGRPPPHTDLVVSPTVQRLNPRKTSR
jgi:PAS domain S-box-containing protein